MPLKPNALVQTLARRLSSQLADAWTAADTFPDVCVIDHGDLFRVHDVCHASVAMLCVAFVSFTNMRVCEQCNFHLESLTYV